MKTASSVPDETYVGVERLMKKHGLNRSQFYAEAAARYADTLESSNLTARSTLRPTLPVTTARVASR